MTTPQRALELAEILEDASPNRDEIWPGSKLADEIAALLRHYAQIMQAETVAYVNEHGNLRGAHLDLRAEPYAQLIIKPTP